MSETELTLKEQELLSILADADDPLPARAVATHSDRFGKHAVKTGLDRLAEKDVIVKDDCHCGTAKVYHA